MRDGFDEFLLWEATTRDTIDFKTAYVDMAGDLVSGLLLSQLVYWHLPSANGKSKLRVYHDGKYWVAKGRAEWHKEIRLTPKQVDRARRLLEAKDLIETALYKFNAAPTVHYRIKRRPFLAAWYAVIAQRGISIFPDEETPDPPEGELDIPERGESLTESTSKTTTIWDQCLDELKLQMTRATFNTWLLGTTATVENGTYTIHVRDHYAVEWLQARWQTPIERTLASVTGQGVAVRFEEK